MSEQFISPERNKETPLSGALQRAQTLGDVIEIARAARFFDTSPEAHMAYGAVPALESFDFKTQSFEALPNFLRERLQGIQQELLGDMSPLVEQLDELPMGQHDNSRRNAIHKIKHIISESLLVHDTETAQEWLQTTISVISRELYVTLAALKANHMNNSEDRKCADLIQEMAGVLELKVLQVADQYQVDIYQDMRRLNIGKNALHIPTMHRYVRPEQGVEVEPDDYPIVHRMEGSQRRDGAIGEYLEQYSARIGPENVLNGFDFGRLDYTQVPNISYGPTKFQDNLMEADRAKRARVAKVISDRYLLAQLGYFFGTREKLSSQGEAQDSLAVKFDSFERALLQDTVLKLRVDGAVSTMLRAFYVIESLLKDGDHLDEQMTYMLPCSDKTGTKNLISLNYAQYKKMVRLYEARLREKGLQLPDTGMFGVQNADINTYESFNIGQIAEKRLEIVGGQDQEVTGSQSVNMFREFLQHYYPGLYV